MRWIYTYLNVNVWYTILSSKLCLYSEYWWRFYFYTCKQSCEEFVLCMTVICECLQTQQWTDNICL